MIGVYVLILVMVVAIGTAVIGMARTSGAAARLRRAGQRIGTALGAGGQEEIGERMRDLARTVPGASAAEASAIVLACRQTFSRQVVPVLVAALTHAAPTVSAEAAQALADLGSPGLRGVWQAWQGGTASPALQTLLLNHPDWLFECLLESFVSGGQAQVAAHEALWRHAAMLDRLRLLRSGSDAVNRLRADHIAAALHLDDGKVA